MNFSIKLSFFMLSKHSVGMVTPGLCGEDPFTASLWLWISYTFLSGLSFPTSEVEPLAPAPLEGGHGTHRAQDPPVLSAAFP